MQNQLGGPNVGTSGLTISPIVAAGILGTSSSPFGFLLGALNRGGLSIDVAINALEEKGLIRSLAQPNLVALSGDTASFLAGGEFPILIPQSLGTVSIDAKRRRLLGAAWEPFAAQTSIVPFAAIAAGRNRFRPSEIGLWRWCVAVVVYALLLGGHAPLIGVSPFPV